MTISKQIYEGIKKALIEGEATVQLDANVINEASALTGSGLGIGGKTYFDEVFSAARFANPFRMGAKQILESGAAAQFVAKTGNAANSINPWLYAATPNSGSPNINTSIWQLPMRVISAQIPVRESAIDDINGLETGIVEDLMMEFSQLEAQSMATNNDQAGSTTNSSGAESGLRGLTLYPTDVAASYGTSGTAMTNGLHTIKTIENSYAPITYNAIASVVEALPPQYYFMESTAWHIHPTLIASLRKLKTSGFGITQGQPLFLEVGDNDGGAGIYMFGFPIIANPYLDAPGVGAVSLILANWNRFLTIVDNEQMVLKRFDQTQPGFVTLYAEKRLVSTIKDPFAGVYLKGI